MTIVTGTDRAKAFGSFTAAHKAAREGSASNLSLVAVYVDKVWRVRVAGMTTQYLGA